MSENKIRLARNELDALDSRIKDRCGIKRLTEHYEFSLDILTHCFSYNISSCVELLKDGKESTHRIKIKQYLSNASVYLYTMKLRLNEFRVQLDSIRLDEFRLDEFSSVVYECIDEVEEFMGLDAGELDVVRLESCRERLGNTCRV